MTALEFISLYKVLHFRALAWYLKLLCCLHHIMVDNFLLNTIIIQHEQLRKNNVCESIWQNDNTETETRDNFCCIGYLQVSRSIGDFYMKKPEFHVVPLLHLKEERPLMTVEPSILIRKLKLNDLFVIFASDGLWEHLTDQEAVDIVYKNPKAVSPIGSGTKPEIWILLILIDWGECEIAGNSKAFGESRPPRGCSEKRDEIWWHNDDHERCPSLLPRRYHRNCHLPQL